MPALFGIIPAKAQQFMYGSQLKLAAASSGGTPWSLLNKNSGDTPSLNITIASTTVHSTLILAAQMFPITDAIVSIADNASGGSNTYAHGTNYRTSEASAGAVEMWYAKDVKSGTTQITVTMNGGGAPLSMYCWEVSGLSLTAPLDDSQVLSNSTAATDVSGATVTASASGDFIAALLMISSGVTGQYSGNEFTSDLVSSTGAGLSHITSTSAGSGTHTPRWASSSGTIAAVTAAFKL